MDRAATEIGAQDPQKAFEDALHAAAERGETFESGGQQAAADEAEYPVASLEQEGEPSIQYLKGRGPHRVGSFVNNPIEAIAEIYGGGNVYYPDDDSTDLAGVVMCPGFSAVKSSIAGWGPFFASHGIVLYAIDTKTVLDQVIQRAPEIQAALRDLKAMGRNHPKLRGRMGDRWGVSGWSMGGGGSWITAANQADEMNIKTAVSLAGHNLTAGGALGVSAQRIRIPTLLMNGSTDVTYLGGLGQSDSTYGAIPDSTPKLLWETGTCGHFCWGGPGGAGNGISGVLMMAWQKTFLEGDERYRSLLTRSTVSGAGALTTTFKTNVN